MNSLNQKKLPKLAVIRGHQPRMTEMYFYSYFNNFDVRMIGDKNTGWIVENQIPKNVKFIHSPLYPKWGYDPWTKFLSNYYVHRSFQYVKDLEKLVADCDVLNVSDLFYFYCWQTAEIAQKTGKKLVAIVWENIPKHISTYLPPYSLAVKQMLKTTDLFIARSFGAKKYLLSIGANPQKIQVIYKGIDLTMFKPRKVIKNQHKTRILYVGQLVKSKGILELLEAFRILYSEFNNLELLLVGRSYGEPLEKIIQNYFDLPIILKSQIDYDKLPQVYQEADIYCQLSQDWKYLNIIPGGNDWFPYSVIEAMTSGLPIVATNCGGIPEQLGNQGNLIVPQNNVAAAYQALKKFIISPQLRQKIGLINRQRAIKLFNIKSQAEKTEAAVLNLFK